MARALDFSAVKQTSHLPPTLWLLSGRLTLERCNSQLKVIELKYLRYSRSPCCFAGDDELVVGASDDTNIYIWSATAWHVEIGRPTNNTPLQVLRGHNNRIRSVRYSVQNGVLASCDENGVVKLWSTDSF